MKKEKINKSTISTWKTLKKIRNNWNGINPVTKILNNKKKIIYHPRMIMMTGTNAMTISIGKILMENIIEEG